MPEFHFATGTVAFPGDAPKVVVSLGAGKLTKAATLKYRLEQRNAEADFFPASAASGFLYFQPGDSAQAVAVPIDWQRVPPYAQYQVQLQLQGFMNARTADQSADVALTVFGVPEGTCPPGTARGKRVATTNSLGMQWWQGGNATDKSLTGKF